MTLASYQTDAYYIKVVKMTVSTNDKTSPLASDFNYEIRLPEAVNNVVGIKLVEWSFSRDVIPTFYPKTTTLVGNNRLDFRLTNPEISPVPGNFTVEFPRKALDYQNFADISRDFHWLLTNMMENATLADPIWATKIRFGFVHDTQRRTMISTITDNTYSETTRTKLTFLFGSGPSRPSFISRTLGFDQVDVDSGVTYFYDMPPNVEVIVSPYPTRLRPSDYLDIFVDESPQRPMQRIFFDDPLRTRYTSPAQSFHRFEVDTERPPRRLDRLHIRIRYRNNIDPGTFLDGVPVTMPNFMTFHFFTIEDSISSRPDYVKQNLSY